jgi:ankyrin repeat protein
VTLDETYQRTLEEINEADWEFAHRLFQFVVVASRPLRVEELAELLAFDFTAGPIPKLHEDWRLEDPVDAVLSACSSLLAVVNVEGSLVNIEGFLVNVESSLVIQFSHFSVKEFLTSTRLGGARDVIHQRYHVSTTPAHILALQACLGTLLQLDNDVITRDSLENYPLAKYAAEHWVDHAQFKEEVSQRVEDGMKELFDPNKQHLAVCFWINDLVYRRRRPYNNYRYERPSPTSPSPLHYAAFWGFHSIVHFLVVERSQDVHSRKSSYDRTPLHMASVNGHKQIVYYLLERGANVSARDRNWDAPLHLALRRGHVEVAHMLIELSAGFLAPDGTMNSPLHLASEMGLLDFARMLIERGAHVSDRGRYRQTPLHLALRRGHVEVAHMLIEHDANVKAQDKDGETPLDLASRDKGLAEVARVLTQLGAHHGPYYIGT